MHQGSWVEAGRELAAVPRSSGEASEVWCLWSERLVLEKGGSTRHEGRVNLDLFSYQEISCSCSVTWWHF